MDGLARRRHPRWLLKEGQGVTFIELIILTLAMVILASVGIPRMKPVVQTLRLRGAAWQLAGDLRLARQRAVSTKQRFRICVSSCVITVKPGQYSLERDIGTPGSPSWISETGVAIRLPPDVTISASATATFSSSGVANPSSTYTLTHPIGEVTGEYRVAVAITGQVSVCKQPSCP
jgi:Tfp pilus assembly protein FimT